MDGNAEVTGRLRAEIFIGQAQQAKTTIKVKKPRAANQRRAVHDISPLT
jgi:hypothetical protein